MPHFDVDVPGGHIHVEEAGTGPLVLFVHGFPESRYSWRHQLGPVAAAGFRAVAMDVRGYGRSSRPAAVEAYRMTELVADVVGVTTVLGDGRAVLVGHDWGSPIVANTALLHPDVVRAVALLSVPYHPRGGPRPTDVFGRVGGRDEFYMAYFQQPGRAEAEIEPDVEGWLAGLYASVSGDTRRPGRSPFFVSPGERMRDRFVTDRRPAWLGDEELAVYAAEFARTGVTGALNRYRNVDRDWAELVALDGAPITQPSLFVGGALDETTRWGADAIAAFPTTLPGLRGTYVLDGIGHWVQQEAPDVVNRLLLDWLRDLPA